MRILVLAHNFTPEIAATSFRTHQHARVWVEQGHDVTVVTCVPNWPHGKVFAGYRNRLYQEETLDGIRVIRLGTCTAANKGFLWRSVSFVSFMVSAVLQCWRFPAFDVLIATSPQFLVAVAGWMVSLLRWRPWVFEIRDLWPDALRATGTMRGPLLKLLEWLAMFLYRRARRIIAVTYTIKDILVERGVDPRKIDVVTNGVDAERFNAAAVKFDARQRLGIDRDVFLAGYIGTTGVAHGLETVVEAANLCRRERDLHFLIMGEGARREALETEAAKLGVPNLTFADFVPHGEVPSYLVCLDLGIIHLLPDPLFRTAIPSKMFELMAMETPILMAVECDGARLLRESGAGLCIAPGDPLAMADAVQHAQQNRAELARMGRRGGRAAQTRFSRRERAMEVLEVLGSLLGEPRTAPQTTGAIQPSPAENRRKAA